jgi:capsid protein
VRNNGYAANAIESWAGNVAGSGIKPSSSIADAELKAEVQRLWLDWTDESDAEGFTDFYGQQRRAAREMFIAGEVFFRFRPRRVGDGLAVPLQLQMIPLPAETASNSPASVIASVEPATTVPVT